MTARSMLAQAATKLANISDQTLQEAADTWLRREDLTGVTFKSLVSAMENQFQIDLTDKRILFKRVLEVFTLEHMKTEQDEDEDEEDEKEDMDDDDGNGIGKDEENDNDSDSDSDEEETGTFANSSSKRKNTSSSQSPSGKEQKGSGGGGGGFTKEVQLSNELTELLGVCMLPRTQVTKKIWEYIKSNSLQNPQDKREILCDGALEKLFKTKKINMFKMTKALSLHMKGFDDLQDGPEDGGKVKIKKEKEKTKAKKSSSTSAAKKSRVVTKGNKDKGDKKKRQISEEKLKEMRESQTKSGTGFNKLMQCSPGLVGLLGLDQVSRPQAVKLMWERIRKYNLQNPDDKREIILDSEMKAAFGCDRFTMFSMNKYIAQHLTKIEPTSNSSA